MEEEQGTQTVAPVVEPIEASATTLPANRNFAIKRPGHIALASSEGSYPGCKLLMARNDGGELGDVWGVTIEEDARTREALAKALTTLPTPVDYVNEFFRQHGGLLVVDIQVHQTGVAVLYTNQLEGDELEEFQEFSRTISMHMQEWRDKRDQAREAARAKAAQDQADAKEILELGKKAKEHNLFGKLRELEKQIEALKDELKDARKEAKKEAKAAKGGKR